MNPVVLVPVKAFTDAKARLAPLLTPSQREALARWTAERVLAAAGELPVYVACDHDDVAAWATARGATVLWHPGVGLNAAVNRSIADLRERGVGHVVVAHGDLPRARALATIAIAHTVTLVPDLRRDGTNAAAVPTSLPFQFAYGPGSFRRHLAQAIEAGLPVAVRNDPLLALDIDTPTDLTHPLVQEVLPAWLPTNQANPTPTNA
ncbi:MAG: 2-phospho-L-lactate guanylyltransferase [Actinomycetota bacterium]|nr:2-phospho-L-lactate guanylyltransferase [Actinomycetota bacterium]